MIDGGVLAMAANEGALLYIIQIVLYNGRSVHDLVLLLVGDEVT